MKEGRTVYNIIEKAILFMLPTNVAQALVIAVVIFFGFTMPIAAHLGNRHLPVGIGAVAVLHLLFTHARPLQVLFDNEAVPLWVWPWLLLGGMGFFLLVEAEKLVIRSTGSLRRMVTAVEAGT